MEGPPVLACMGAWACSKAEGLQLQGAQLARFERHTLLSPQPLAMGQAEEAVRQADHFINTGELKVAEEKQLFDCLLIDESNVDNYTGPFTLDQSS